MDAAGGEGGRQPPPLHSCNPTRMHSMTSVAAGDRQQSFSNQTFRYQAINKELFTELWFKFFHKMINMLISLPKQVLKNYRASIALPEGIKRKKRGTVYLLIC
jgi:hypothetical protein